MKTYNIAAIPGDGIGTEVIAAGIQVLESLAKRDGGFALRFEHFDWGSNYYLKHGEMMPADGLDRLKPFDAIYFGAVGSKEVPDHITLWGLRLNICQSFDQYANVRPARVLPGIDPPLKLTSPADLDWVIVRENSEGEYSGQGGRTHKGLPEEVATEVSVFTRNGVERIQRFAFELARNRPQRHLTLITKSNAQRHGMVMWDEIFDASRQGLSGRADRQDAGRRRHHAHGAEARLSGCDGRDQSARGHPLRPCRRAIGQPWNRPDRQPESRAHSFRRCSSRSMGRRSISRDGALPIRSALSGPP